jgi:1-acyl-sn-glycerol-3-phosphate acyltransferase
VLLVALLDPGVELGIVTRRDHRVGELIAEEAQLLQGAAEVVGVGGARRQRLGAVQLSGPPLLTYIHKHGGVFPIRRGNHDEEAFETVRQLLEQEEMLLVYAEGGRSRSQQLGEPKSGIGRIALESGAPIVPVAIHGSEYARHWKRFRFPKTTVQFGEPLTFPVEDSPSHERQLEVAREVFTQVREMYERLAGAPKGSRR